MKARIKSSKDSDILNINDSIWVTWKAHNDPSDGAIDVMAYDALTKLS
jgi:hypothetical protein